jgi:hypothetical protein
MAKKKAVKKKVSASNRLHLQLKEDQLKRDRLERSRCFRFEPVSVFNGDEIIKGEIRKLYEDSYWEVRYKIGESWISWRGLDTLSYPEAREIAADYILRQYLYDQSKQMAREQKVVEGINRLSLTMLHRVRETVANRLSYLFTFQTRVLFSEHELNVFEQSYVGVVLLQKQLEEAQAALAAAEEKHKSLVDKTEDKVRVGKCKAVAEQIREIERGEEECH